MSWSYSNQSAWGGSCNLTGSAAFQQSPIDFNTVGQNGVPAIASSALGVTIFNVAGAPMQWDDHDNNVAFSTQLSMAPLSTPATVLSGPTNITVLGFHFHCPPEHKLTTNSINLTGTPDFAVHIKALASFNVNGVPRTQLVVFAIAGYWQQTLAGWGELDRFLSNYVAPISGCGGTLDAGTLPALVNLFNAWPFWAYVGSLTTPPCTGQVLWFVLDYPMPYTSTQWTTNPATFAPVQTALSNLAPAGQLLFPNNRALQPILPSTQVYLVAPNQPPKAPSQHQLGVPKMPVTEPYTPAKP